jgi:hypothetical protein
MRTCPKSSEDEAGGSDQQGEQGAVRSAMMTGQLSSCSSASSPETQLRLLLDVGDAPKVGIRTEDDVCLSTGLESTYA